MSKYMNAAEKIFLEGEAYYCDALGEKSKEGKLFIKYFDTGLGHKLYHGWFGYIHGEENQLARQLALLFMEQIEKDEKRSKKAYKRRKSKTY